MTKTQELLEAVRAELGGATDYAIAKALHLHRPRVHEYHTGKAQADAYAAAQMALVLKRDPLEVIAEVEAEAARSKEAREFWRSFCGGLTLTLGGGVLLLTSAIFASVPSTATAASPSHNGRLRQSQRPNKGPARGFFWARRNAETRTTPARHSRFDKPPSNPKWPTVGAFLLGRVNFHVLKSAAGVPAEPPGHRFARGCSCSPTWGGAPDSSSMAPPLHLRPGRCPGASLPRPGRDLAPVAAGGRSVCARQV